MVKVNPAITSRTFYGFGSVNAVLLLPERVYSLSNCGIEIDRDVNAVRNILRLAQAMFSAGVSTGEFGSKVKEIDGVGLRCAVVKRTQNSIMVRK